MAGEELDSTTTITQGADSSVFRTRHQQTELYVILIWHQGRKCHQQVIRHASEDLINITHVLKVFVSDRNELNKIVAKDRKKEMPLLRHAKSFAGHHGYQGTYVSCKAAEKLVAREFEQDRDKLQRLQLILRLNPNDSYDFLSLSDVVGFNKESEGLQSLANTRNMERTHSNTTGLSTMEDNHCRVLSKTPTTPIEMWNQEADDITGQLAMAKDKTCDDAIVVQPHSVHLPSLRAVTVKQSNPSFRPASPNLCKNPTSICSASLSKRQLPIDIEETALSKKQKSSAEFTSAQNLSGSAVDSSERMSPANIIGYHISAGRQQGRRVDWESRVLKIKATPNSIVNRTSDDIDIVSQIRAAESVKARMKRLASDIVVLVARTQSLETNLKSAQSNLSDKRLVLAELSHEIEALSHEMENLRHRLEELGNKHKDLSHRSSDLDRETERQDRELEAQNAALEASKSELIQKQEEHCELILRKAEYMRILKPYRDQLNGFFSEGIRDLTVS